MMRSKYNVMALFLPLIVLLVSSVGWPQQRSSAVVDSGPSRAAQNVPVVQQANLSVQESAKSGGQQAQPKTGVMPTPIVPFIVDYQYGKLYLIQKIRDNPDYTDIDALIYNGPPPVYQ